MPERGMEAQRHTVERRGDAARAQIGFGMRSLNRYPGAKQPARGFRRPFRRGHLAGGDFERQAEKMARLVAKVAEIIKATIGGDEVEEIAMLPCGGIGPFAGGAGTVIRPGETDIEAAAGRIADIADRPIAAMAAAIREIISAHGLGMTRESLRQNGGLTGHESPRSCRAAIGDADRRMPLHQPGDNAGAGLADGNEQP